MFSASDQRHLETARAWLELSAANWQEANAELDEITPLMRAHPDVLKVRIAIYLSAGNAAMAETVADHLKQVYDGQGSNN